MGKLWTNSAKVLYLQVLVSCVVRYMFIANGYHIHYIDNIHSF